LHLQYYLVSSLYCSTISLFNKQLTISFSLSNCLPFFVNSYTQQ
jgi:hypothetical protein